MIESWVFFVIVTYTVPHPEAGKLGGKLFGPYPSQAYCVAQQGRIDTERGLEVIHVTPCIKVPNREKL